MKKMILSTIVLCGGILFFAAEVHAEGYTLIETMPGAGQAGSQGNFETYIKGLYNFAVAFSAISALLMITIGGFYYILSAGNQAQAGTAKTLIKDALLGLAVVFFTWLILYEINPELVKSQPSLSSLQQSANTAASGVNGVTNQLTVSQGSTVQGSNDNKNHASEDECKRAGNASCKAVQLAYDDSLDYRKTDNGWVEASEEECGQSGAVCKSGARIKADDLYNPKTSQETKQDLNAVGIEVPDQVNAKNIASQTVQSAQDVATEVCGAGGCDGMKMVSNPGYSGANEISVSYGDEKKDDDFIYKLSREANRESDNGEYGDRASTERGGIYTVKKTFVYPADHALAGQVVEYEKTYVKGLVFDDLKSSEIIFHGDKTKPVKDTYQESE